MRSSDSNLPAAIFFSFLSFRRDKSFTVDVAFTDAITVPGKIQMLGLSLTGYDDLCENMPGVLGLASESGDPVSFRSRG